MELNKIYNEDNISLISSMPDDFIDLTVTSPPYDNLRDYKGYTFDFETLAKELYRVTKPGGVVVWVVGDATINGSESGTSFRQALKFMDSGFNLHDTMIYEKSQTPFGSNLCYLQSFEYMFVLSKGKPKSINLIRDRKNKRIGEESMSAGGLKVSGEKLHRVKKKMNELGKRKNIWRYGVGGGKTGHPAVFPYDLAKDHILSWSSINDLVFDPFMGSGTTAVASLDTGRKYIGAEIAKEYVDIANERIKNHATQTDIFDVLEGK